MNNKEYQEMVEKKYGKSLREVMEELCIDRDVTPFQGATILNVPESTFKAWRNRFRLGPLQRIADEGERYQEEQIDTFKNELQETDLTRPFKYSEQISFDGFREILERHIELIKAEAVALGLEGFGLMNTEIKISMFKGAISNLDKYMNGTLLEEYLRTAEKIKELVQKR